MNDDGWLLAKEFMRGLTTITTSLVLVGCAAPFASRVQERNPEDRSIAAVERPRHIGLRERAAAGRPLLAIALGGGGLRGYAHIGVLQALEESGIHPDAVVGTSIGAIIGAAYASGMSPQQLWQQAQTTDMLALADLTLLGPGLIRGDALARWTNRLVGGQLIERFPTKFAAIATDLEHAKSVVIDRGDAGQAARASASIPGVFLPAVVGGRPLVDGGVVALVPVRVARDMGASVVVGVDIYCHGERYPTGSMVSTWLRVSQTQSCLLAEADLAAADIVIAPAVTVAGVGDASAREAARRAGYEATIRVVPDLRVALSRREEAAARPAR